MTITINLNSNYETQLEILNNNIGIINNIEQEQEIEKQNLKQIYQILNNNELKLICKKILKNEYIEKFTYEDLNSLFEIIEGFYSNISKIKEDVDISIFFKKGNIIDIRGLKQELKRLGRYDMYKHVNFKRLEELFKNPPEKLLPQDNSTQEYIIYDKFVVRKYLYGIVQMIVNEMDLLIGYVGEEGMGKSAGCSQDMNLIYYILKEINLIQYEYNINDMWFESLDSFIEAENNFFEQRFRILGLDEGNELNRQDWQDERVKTFFQRLRRERFNQRIKFICLPQLGELITGIVLSRMNFIFHMYSYDKVKIGTLDKGYCDFYIIPRSNKIYSPKQKREISREEVKKSLTINLEDKKKKFITQLPKNILIKTIKKNHIWGFSKKDYNKNLKEKNKTFSVSKGIKLSELECFYYFKKRPNLKDWNIDRKEESEMYSTLAKMDKKICRIFEENPDKLIKYENLLKYKKERKKDK